MPILPRARKNSRSPRRSPAGHEVFAESAFGGSAVLVGQIFRLFVRLFAAADFKNLHTGMDPTDTQTIVARLPLENLPCQLPSAVEEYRAKFR